MSGVVLFDGTNLAHRSWHGAGGDPAYATNLLRAAIRRPVDAYQPRYAAVATERGGSFRRDIDPAYKAHRAAKEPAFAEWLEWALVGHAEIAGVPTVMAPGFEADDVIATLTAEAVEMGLSVAIVTADKDAWALVDVGLDVFVLTPDGRVIGDDEVHQKLGIWPDEVRAYKALVGDASDNVKGVPGIGPVRARWVIEEMRGRWPPVDGDAVIDGCLEVLAWRPEWLGRAGGEAAARVAGRLAWDLVGLRTDAPVGRHLGECSVEEPIAV